MGRTRNATATVDLVRTALLAALSVALGYAAIGIPNLELISAAVFASGALVGPRRGALVGAVAETLFAGFNPMGVSPPPLFVAQVVCFAGIGAAGGAFGAATARVPGWLRAGLAALCGFTVTVAYDVVTACATWLGVREQAALPAIVLGALSFPFPLAHALGNTVAFAVVVPAVQGALARRWRR